MNKAVFEAISILLVGGVITVAGVSLKTGDIIAGAKTSANRANVHQLATVLELYYLDHEKYPEVRGGEALVRALSEGGYILTLPEDPAVFLYAPKNGGQQYELRLKDLP